MHKYNKKLIWIGLLTLAAIVLFLTININPKYIQYALKLRVPKIFAMILASICLGAGTMIFQTITNNRVLTPCILGLTSLYVMLQTIIVFFLGASHVLVTNRNLNFILSLILLAFASVLVFRVLFLKQGKNVLYILLIGTIMGQFFGSISSFLQRVIDPNEFLALQNKLFASFKNMNSSILLITVICIVLLFLYTRNELKQLDVIALGREHAINLGINYDKAIKKLMLSVTLLVGVATALVGPITFLGFIITNVAREIFKTYRHTYLIGGSILIGIFTLAFAQVLVEHIFNFSTTLSVLINLIGGIYFIATLLIQSKKA